MHVNLKFPISDSDKGYFFGSNETTKDAIISDILHILVTKKGDRFYNPQFGTSLQTFLFEPNDNITLSDIKEELSNSLKYSLPNVKVDKLEMINDDILESMNIRIIVIDTDDIFLEPITIDLEV